MQEPYNQKWILALINREEIFLIFDINYWFFILLEILKPFQCLCILLQRVKLCTAVIHVLFFFFFLWFCFQMMYFGPAVCCAGMLAGFYSSQNTSGDALGVTGVSEV